MNQEIKPNCPPLLTCHSSPIKVLLIEDNPGDARLIRELLSEIMDIPVKLAYADSLSGGLEHLVKEQSDAVLLDLLLPDSRGFHTFVRAHAEAPQVPIIVMTSLDDKELAIKTLRAGAQDYLIKGQIDSYLLARSIHYAIGRHRMIGELEETRQRQLQQTEKSLGESEERYRTLVEHTYDLIIETSAEGKFLYVSPRHKDILGYETEELLGGDIFENIHPEDRQDAMLEFQRAFVSGSAGHASFRYRHKNGEWRWLESTGKPFKTANGEIRAVIASQDVTERRRMEETLINSEKQYRILYENNPSMYFTVDGEGKVLSVNHFGAEQLGYTPGQLVGQSVLNVFYEEDKGAVLEQLNACLNNPGQVFRWELRKVHNDGSILWVRESARTAEDNAGNIVVLIVCEDITERKRTEKALLESEGRFRVMADTTPAMIWVSGTDKLCTYLNKGWLEFRGRTIEQELGNGWSEGVHPDDFERCLNTYVTAFDARQEFKMDYRLGHSDGEYRWVLDCGTPRFLPDGTFAGYIGAAIDITERKRTEKELSKFKFISDNSNDAHFLINREAKLLYVNSVACETRGYSESELLGMSFPDIDVVFDKSNIRSILSLLQSMKIPPFESIHRRKDGSTFPVEISVTGATFEGEPYLFAVARDITERKKIEKENKKRTEQILYYQKVLLKLAKIDNSDLESALRSITEADSKALGVEQISVWFFNEDRSGIVCADLYTQSNGSHEKGMSLRAEDHPRYFHALEESRSIAADNACADPRTSEFTEGYLKPFGITSMMDVPVWIGGKVEGVICHEHTGPIREWTLEEQDFASSIADLVSLALEASGHRRAEENLKEILVELSKKNRYETIIGAVTRSIHQSIALQEVLENTVKAIGDNIADADGTGIFLVEGQEAVLRAYDGKIYSDWFLERVRRIPYGRGATWKTIIDEKIIYCADAETDTVIGPAGKEVGIKSYLSIPVRFEEKTVGALHITSLKKNAFGEGDVELMEIVAQQIDVAISNAKYAEMLRGSEESLQKINEELEIRVEERIAELKRTNEQLKTEVIERKLTEEALSESLLQLSKKSRYELIINSITQSVHKSINLQEVLENAVEALMQNIDSVGFAVHIYMVEGENAVLKANRGAPDWYIERAGRIPYPKGFTWKTIIDGKPRYCADVDKDEFIGPAGRDMGTKSYLSMPIRYEGNVVGVVNINSFQKDAFNEDELKLLDTVAQQIEIAIGNAKQAEALQQSEERLTASLKEKELLLKEIHHRVKNNLQVISSLLNIQAQHIADEQSRSVFLQSRNRVRSMAFVHQQLYQTKDITRVDFENYVKNLVSDLQGAFYMSPGAIKVNLDVKDVFFDIDTAIPCGLLLNELISNCFKHAFPEGKRGEVWIALRENEGNGYKLTVKDDGVGFPIEFDFQNTESLGLQLVTTLAKQLNGTVAMERDNGTAFHIAFAEIKYKDRR